MYIVLESHKIWKFAIEAMAGVLSRFSFATAAEKQLKQRKHWKKHCFFGCQFGKKWCWEKEIAKEIENYDLTQLNTLLERSNAEFQNKHA